LNLISKKLLFLFSAFSDEVELLIGEIKTLDDEYGFLGILPHYFYFLARVLPLTTSCGKAK